MPEVIEFERKNGDNPFAARLKAIKKNFGDHKSFGKGVSEMRIDYGTGYRIYYGMHGDELVILLLAGAKPTQESDIALAQAYWAEYKRG